MCLDIFYRLFIGMWEPLDSNFVSGLIVTHTHRSPYHSNYKVCAKVYWRWRHPNKHSVSDLLSEIKSRFAWYTINLLTLILRIGRQLEKSTLQLGAFTYLHICCQSQAVLSVLQQKKLLHCCWCHSKDSLWIDYPTIIHRECLWCACN